MRVSQGRAKLLSQAGWKCMSPGRQFPVSERLVALSDQIVEAMPRPIGPPDVDERKCLRSRPLHPGMGKSSAPLQTGTPIALLEIADARQKRWGKRFRAVLAEIASQRFGGPPHRISGSFYTS